MAGDRSSGVSHLEQEAWIVVDRLVEAGYEAYLVGGCVRDRLLGRAVYDYDITTSALPQEVMELFPRTVPTGIHHGTVTVQMEQAQYEVTTFRTDGKYEDGRRPEQVTFVRSLREDLARRDFTINAMALGRDGTLHDPFGGQDDLEKKVVRAVGEPRKRFEEDALRMLRGVRFAAQLGFAIEEKMLGAIACEGHALRQISRERIREEWHKMLLSASPDTAIDLLLQTETMRYVIARGPATDEPWRHAMLWARRAPLDLAVRYAAVLTALAFEEPRVQKVLQDLKLSGQQKRDVRGTLQVYAYGDPSGWKDSDWRQRFFQHGADDVRRGVLLYATIHEPERMGDWEEEIAARQAVQPLWSLQDLAADGPALIAAGVPVGPLIGRTQKRLAQWVLQEPERNVREVLVQQAMEWMEEYGAI